MTQWVKYLTHLILSFSIYLRRWSHLALPISNSADTRAIPSRDTLLQLQGFFPQAVTEFFTMNSIFFMPIFNFFFIFLLQIQFQQETKTRSFSSLRESKLQNKPSAKEEIVLVGQSERILSLLQFKNMLLYLEKINPLKNGSHTMIH